MKKLLLCLTFISISSLSSFAIEEPETETTILTTLLKATQDNDLELFESVCDKAMQDAMTEKNLTQVSKEVSDLMKLGYKKVYLGALERGKIKTHLWKIDFDKEGAPDLLAELSISDGKVAGFYIR